jgi:hypothetical protein
LCIGSALFLAAHKNMTARCWKCSIGARQNYEEESPEKSALFSRGRSQTVIYADD